MISSTMTPRVARDVLENWPEPEAHWLVILAGHDLAARASMRMAAIAARRYR